jgi:hypothetical protein
MTIHRLQRNWGCRIHETVLYGLAAIVMENERVRLTFLAGKGTDLVEFLYKPLDLDFAWLAPAGIRNPLALHSTSPDTLATFIDFYPGGWQEIFPNAGEASMWAGAQYGQHGEVSALPWDVTVVEDTAHEVAVRFTVRGVKTPCIIEKVVRLRAGEAGPSIEETVTNESPVPFDYMWGHHITFGTPFLMPGARIALPDGLTATPHGTEVEATGRRVGSADPFAWPTGINAASESEDFSIVPDRNAPSELFYLSGFPDETAWYEITRPDSTLGIRVDWDAQALPYLWYWQEFGATKSYPWYGRNYNIGLEPSASYPTTGLPDAVANGSARTLAPGATQSLWLTATVIGGADGDTR